MYSVLELDWNNILSSDYLFKCNTIRKTIEFSGSEFEDTYTKDSVIIIMYNIVVGDPLILCERVKGRLDIDLDSMEGMPEDYVAHIDNVSIADREYTDIVLTRKDLYNAIISEEEKREMR